MIGTIDVEVNAAHPSMPLCEFAAFVNSPSHVRVRNVPRGVGNWQLTAVYLSVNYPDNSIPSVSLTHVGALWTGTIPGSASAGRSVNGYQITADGVDEIGNAITGYVLGAGDVVILDRDAAIVIGDTTYYLHLLDSVPATPHIGDVATVDGSLKLYDGTAWVSFAAGATIEIVAPSTDPADVGKAADAKATGDALATRPTKAQLDAGWWSEWTVMRDGVDVTAQVNQPAFYDNIWHASFVDEDAQMDAPNPEGSDDATSLTWVGYDIDEDFAKRTYTATRHRVSAPVPTKPSDIGAQPKGDYALRSELPSVPVRSVNGKTGAVVLTGSDILRSTGSNLSVATSLEVADQTIASLQTGKADAADIPYDLPANATVISSASQEVVEGVTVRYGEADLADRTENRVIVLAEIDELRVWFPARARGKVRDFGLRVEVGTGSAALTAPALTVDINSGAENVPILENPGGKMPALADGTATAKGVTLLYFSESAFRSDTMQGVFLAKGEIVKEVS